MAHDAPSGGPPPDEDDGWCTTRRVAALERREELEERPVARGYKVRLGDGSEIGPMDLDAVRAWFTQGLIDRDSPVLKPGATRWTRLSELLGSQERAPSPRTLPRPKRPAASTSPVRLPPRLSAAKGRGEWFAPLAGVLFLLGAAISGFWAIAPERWLPALDAAPWKEIALVQVILGLFLLPSWELGRKLVRILVLVVAVALFPLAGFVLAQGMRGRPVLVLAGAWIVASGFFVLLSGSGLSTAGAGLSVVAILLGWAGVIRFGMVAETPEQRKIRDSVSAERHFGDPSLDVSVDLPKNWSVLRNDQHVVAVPPEARAVFVQPRLLGFAYLVEEPSPKDVFSLDDYLKAVVGKRRKALPSPVEVERSISSLGRLSARQVVTSWESEDVRYREQTVVWKDGWVYFGLFAWIPDDGSSIAARELDSLIGAVSSNGAMEARLQRAVQTATQAVPFLSQQSAEMLMGKSAAEVLEPQEVFRRSYKWASSGLGSLDQSEGRELSGLTSVVFASVGPRERVRLASYFERVKLGRPSAADEDREMSQLMKTAVLRLSSARLARLQALYEKAIRAAIGRG
jgi:hypothetical protein